MTEKIDWYREVLELEPHSRLFFPLSRMLAEENRLSEALSYLKEGLARHPEFMEARLLYVDLLHRAGQHEECTQQVHLLERSLSMYAGFWEAWGTERVSSAGDEAGWALAFLAGIFGNKGMSLQAVMEKGVAAILQESIAQMPSAANPLRDAEPEAAAPQEAAMPAAACNTLVQSLHTPGEMNAIYERENATQNAQQPLAEKVLAEKNTFAQTSLEPKLPFVAEVATHQQDVMEEVSVRTRSMADVLAEQGDVQGALDIYMELKKNAVSPEIIMELQQRIDALLANLEENEQNARSEQMSSVTGKDKLISMLEALAERVEARAQS